MCASVDSNKGSFAFSSRFSTVVFDVLEGKHENCVLGDSNRGRLVRADTGGPCRRTMVHSADMEDAHERRESSQQSSCKESRATAARIQTAKSIPGHASHKRGLQRHIRIGTLVNNLARRGLAVPVINRRKTADESLINRLSNADFVLLSGYI